MRLVLPFLFAILFVLPLDPALVLAQTPILAANLSDGEREAIRHIVEAQLDAFRRDDATAAFALNSPGIQSTYHTADGFMVMVRRTYRGLIRPQEVQFRTVAQNGDEVAQLVYVRGPDGVPRMALYSMTRLGDGTWRINGCRLRRVPEASA